MSADVPSRAGDRVASGGGKGGRKSHVPVADGELNNEQVNVIAPVRRDEERDQRDRLAGSRERRRSRSRERERHKRGSRSRSRSRDRKKRSKSRGMISRHSACIIFLPLYTFFKLERHRSRSNDRKKAKTQSLERSCGEGSQLNKERPKQRRGHKRRAHANKGRG